MFDYVRKPSMDSLTQVADAATPLHDGGSNAPPRKAELAQPVGCRVLDRLFCESQFLASLTFDETIGPSDGGAAERTCGNASRL